MRQMHKLDSFFANSKTHIPTFKPETFPSIQINNPIRYDLFSDKLPHKARRIPSKRAQVPDDSLMNFGQKHRAFAPKLAAKRNIISRKLRANSIAEITQKVSTLPLS